MSWNVAMLPEKFRRLQKTLNRIKTHKLISKMIIFFTNSYMRKIQMNGYVIWHILRIDYEMLHPTIFIQLCAEIPKPTHSDLWDDQFSSQIPTRAKSTRIDQFSSNFVRKYQTPHTVISKMINLFTNPYMSKIQTNKSI